MEARHHQAIQDIDQTSLELLLVEHLKDPTPAVLRNNTNYTPRCLDRPASHPPVPSLRVATERCLSQLPGLTAPAPTRNSAVPADPLSKEDISPLGDCSNQLQHSVRRKSTSATAHAALVISVSNQAPPASSLEPEPSTSVRDKRKHVLCELMSTEEAYVSDLKVLVAVFAVPLCQYAGSRALQMELILHPLQMLFAFQHRFLRLLRRATHVVAVAQLFAAEAVGFEAYIGYCSHYHWLCGTLDLLEADPEWSGFLGEVQAQINVHCGKRRLGLRDFLIKPVQRICKYPLFLKDLVKHTNQAAEATAHAELNSALVLVRNVCEAIDQEQQRNDSLRLRQAVLSNYSDNMELPLNLVSKLGNIVLSGPLRVVSYSNRGSNAPNTLGCVLFRRFFIVLKPKRSAMLLPQFWFPLHTMQLVDDGAACAWWLVHIGSGQRMLFEARSDEEKRAWMDKLNEAISVSTARLVARRAKSTPPGQRPALLSASSPTTAIHSSHVSATKSAGSSPFPAPPADVVVSSSNAENRDLGGKHIGYKPSPFGHGTATTIATAEPATPLANHNHNHRSFWHHGSAPVSKTSRTDKRFEAMTSPELLRLSALAKLKQGSLGRANSQRRPHLFSPPPFRLPLIQPQPAPQEAIAPAVAATSRANRMSTGSNPSHATAVEPDWAFGVCSDREGSTVSSAGSTFHEAVQSQSSRQQSLCHRESSHSSNGSNHAGAQPAYVLTDTNTTPTLSSRLLRLLGHLSIRKHRSGGRPKYPSAGELAKEYSSRSRSFGNSGSRRRRLSGSYVADRVGQSNLKTTRSNTAVEQLAEQACSV
ncbi:hypothetical protein GGH94_003651 [Coemansia aciculifera]|uniref:DH domain-containing protein n=1 Tax=Coemansia aciculifera TaxID=417176 RepID=A0A9W8M5K3_9FUNG|nr:hypothetical protein GGH94_003651 [Coemansia aciculifera]